MKDLQVRLDACEKMLEYHIRNGNTASAEQFRAEIARLKKSESELAKDTVIAETVSDAPVAVIDTDIVAPPKKKRARKTIKTGT